MYTEEDIVTEIKDIQVTNRCRPYLDKRNYLIGILRHKYNYTEQKIEDLTGIKRSTIHHSIYIAAQLLSYKDPCFIDNVSMYIEKFPYDFISYKEPRKNKVVKVISYINMADYKRVKKYQEANNIFRTTTAYKELITKGLTLWEE